MIYILYFIISFFVGSIPFGYLIVKKAKNQDIRNFGSGNIGATNVARVMGIKWAFLTFLLDGLKGLVTVAIARKIFNIDTPEFIYYMIGFATVLGHVYTPILNFKGGKGVATTIIMLFALNKILAFTMIFAWLLCFFKTKISALSALTAVLVTDVVSFFINDLQTNLVVVALSTFIFYTHRENIKRLIQNKEISFNKK